jgi:hypothetical protein
MILGGEDRFVLADYGREFAASTPQYGLTVVQRAGMYLLYTDWPKVFEALEMLDRAAAPLQAACG